jgi:8-amino-7-oxononanoate synthase
MHLIDTLEARIAQLDAKHLRRRLRPTQSPCAPHVKLNGIDRLAFCSNDYLGLANHPAVVAAWQEGAERYGVGSGASHLISGHSEAHEALEDQLVTLMQPQFGPCRTLFFGSGYTANLAVVPALAATGAATAIFAEALNHASLIDAVRLARGARVQVYPHGDLQALEAQLAQAPEANKLIVTDAVFSMDGDIAPLPPLLALAERYGAWLIVDDAHGFGVLGAGGRGVLEHFNLTSPHLVYMGTLGKAAGVGGAFVAACPQVIEWLVQKARTYIFSTAPPPAMAHALLASLALIAGPQGDARRQHLQTLIAQLRRGLATGPWRLLPSDTPIQPLILGDNATALSVSAQLEAQGLWVPAIRPPTVPIGTARLRIALSAAHSLDDVNRLVSTLQALA